jgi:hypothetical protein
VEHHAERSGRDDQPIDVGAEDRVHMPTSMAPLRIWVTCMSLTPSPSRG